VKCKSTQKQHIAKQKKKNEEAKTKQNKTVFSLLLLCLFYLRSFELHAKPFVRDSQLNLFPFYLSLIHLLLVVLLPQSVALHCNLFIWYLL
jgi:hypothetical protein